MSKSKQKKKVYKNAASSNESLTGAPALMSVIKKAFPDMEGQTIEEIEKDLGISLQEKDESHMTARRSHFLDLAKAGLILNPGPNGIYDCETTDRYVKGSRGDKAGGGIGSMITVVGRLLTSSNASSEKDYTEEATKHWPDWAKKTMEPGFDPKMLSELSRTNEKDSQKASQVQYSMLLTTSPKFPHPIFKWAQRRDLLFLTICVQDCENPEIKVEEKKLHFKGKSDLDGKVYEARIKFFKGIDIENSKYAIRDHGIEFALEKKECAPYWPRLTRETTNQQWLKIDYDKWLDEIEGSSDEDGSFDEEPWHPEDFMKTMRSLSDIGNKSKETKELPSTRLKQKWNPDSDSEDSDVSRDFETLRNKDKESKEMPAASSQKKWNPDSDSEDTNNDSSDSTDYDNLPELE